VIPLAYGGPDERLKRIREQKFVMEDLADPVTVELVTSTQHKVSLRKVMEWMAHSGGVSPKEIAMKAREGGVIGCGSPARDAFPNGNWNEFIRQRRAIVSGT